MSRGDSEVVPEQEQSDERAASLSIQSYEGPLPPPEYLRQYQEAVPGSGQKIVDMMVTQSNHRVSVERDLVGSVAWLIRVAPIFNIVMAVLVVVGGLGAIQLGEPVLGRFIFGVGGLQAGATIVAVLRSFFKGRGRGAGYGDGHTRWSSRDLD